MTKLTNILCNFADWIEEKPILAYVIAVPVGVVVGLGLGIVILWVLE